MKMMTQQTQHKTKTELIKQLNHFNEVEYIKVNGTEKERLIFKNDEVFKVFGEKDTGVLNPFNDYSYNWLHDFLNDFTDYIESSKEKDISQDIDNFRDNINEYIDNRTEVYTSNLTAWLNSNNNNVYYLTEVLEENEVKDGFQLLQLAQYKAIEEIYYNALSIIEKEMIN